MFFPTKGIRISAVKTTIFNYVQSFKEKRRPFPAIVRRRLIIFSNTGFSCHLNYSKRLREYFLVFSWETRKVDQNLFLCQPPLSNFSVARVSSKITFDAKLVVVFQSLLQAMRTAEQSRNVYTTFQNWQSKQVILTRHMQLKWLLKGIDSSRDGRIGTIVIANCHQHVCGCFRLIGNFNRLVRK